MELEKNKKRGYKNLYPNWTRPQYQTYTIPIRAFLRRAQGKKIKSFLFPLKL